MERDSNIDLLRAIGLGCIVLAHVLPPQPILDIRCFDVPLMIFVSGLTCFNKQIPIKTSYFVHRAKRLVIPVWIFLIAYYGLITIAQVGLSINLGLTKELVLNSFSFRGDVAFLWIIRVFLLIALLTPFLQCFNQYVKSDKIYLTLLLIFFLLYSSARFFSFYIQNEFVCDYLYYAIGYGLIFLVGVRMKSLNKALQYSILGVSTTFFVLSYALNTIRSGGVNIVDFKYPPDGMFLSYGLLVSVVLFLVVYARKGNRNNSLVNFVGQNTIWIYLYHIPLINLTARVSMPWAIRYFVVFVFAAVLCYMQIRIVGKLNDRKQRSIWKYFNG